MNNIEFLEEIRQEFEELKYGDKVGLDKLKRRSAMFISRISGATSNYLSDFKKITFFSSIAYSNMPDSINYDAWNRGRNSAINLIETIIEELKLFPEEVDIENIKDKSIDCSKVFIVHGHDDGAKNEVARFIEKLGFEAKILHEQIDSGATIIEKLEKHTDVGFAIVLYTACDVGGVRSKPEDLKPRARQNVVFEHGLLIGKIGRANVVALVKGDLEIPNDISGVVYKSMDISGAWKYSIAREMKSSGYDVDMNKVE
ncbi:MULTISPECIES: TIR domain-containing protein [unclassified Psychrobacter]|uniref:TIR domain-containing protein n=1 Tax=unclassified Psychrobacter TaxID=196806 RepID=UPI00384FECA1